MQYITTIIVLTDEEGNGFSLTSCNSYKDNSQAETFFIESIKIHEPNMDKEQEQKYLDDQFYESFNSEQNVKIYLKNDCI